MSQQINRFVGTLDEVLRFLNSYDDQLFYFDIDPEDPPEGARHFDITTFPPELTDRVLTAIHEGIRSPRFTPGAKDAYENAPQEPIQAGTLECGMNIQPKDGYAWPMDASSRALAGKGWVRFPFQSSKARFGSLNDAFNFYDSVIDTYRAQGNRILLVLTHETFGEGEGFDFLGMDSAGWRAFANRYAPVLEAIVKRYRGKIDAYEVWNEGDAERGNPAAVHFPPADYAFFLDRMSSIIRTHAPEAKVVIGGLVRGADIGAQYINIVRGALNGRLPADAIGVHPYGKGAPNDSTIFSRFGSVADDIRVFGNAAPNVPLWLTEVGALGTHDPSFKDDAALYMRNLYSYLRQNQAARTPVVIWYAYSDAMDSAQKTNGLVSIANTQNPLLFNAYLEVACK